MQHLDQTGVKKFMRNVGYRLFKKVYGEGTKVVQDHIYLKEVVQILEKEGLASYIQINLGLVKDITYYTGLIFECFDLCFCYSQNLQQFCLERFWCVVIMLTFH